MIIDDDKEQRRFSLAAQKILPVAVFGPRCDELLDLRGISPLLAKGNLFGAIPTG